MPTLEEMVKDMDMELEKAIRLLTISKSLLENVKFEKHLLEKRMKVYQEKVLENLS